MLYHCPSLRIRRILLLLSMIIAFSAPVPLHAAGSVALAWNTVTEPNVIGYRLYYGTSSGSYTEEIDVGDNTSASVTNLTANTTYYFVVTAYDSFGIESAPSNEASFDVPGTTVSITGLTSGTVFNATAPITFGATAAKPGGTIAKVVYYQNSTQIGESTGSTGSMTLTNTTAGTYVLTAVAYDSTGATTTSTKVTVTVVPFGVTKTQWLADGSFQLTITGASGHTNNVYVSTDLQNWTLLRTKVNTTGTLLIADPTATSADRRFYQVSAN